ncbi:hypothetical protein [Cryobacterium arcticum]|uniref:Uncharacterized protein n=1 Tax=Cryobacterium arcticum TaxID=670052 RepID=A0A1B1BQL5_9MICO|nr:hypothetical protein [Cryobacterium arcticum]ANP74835.1 hypothetical protein PA27867_3925 [Cryobacterium arcticum]
MSIDAFGIAKSQSAGHANEPSWHLKGQTLHLLARLRDHIERIDTGKAYAVDDLAVVLRAFLHPGRGNDVLGRLAKSAGLESLEIELSRPPSTGPDVYLAFGSVPTSFRQTSELGGRKVSIKQWPLEPVAHIQIGKDAKTWSWANLVSEYANKWGGSHLDKQVPQHLPLLDHLGVSGYGLTTYLFRAAAVEIWHKAHFILKSSWFVKSGRKLTIEEIESFRVGTPGDISEDPRDISSRGRFEWYEWTSSHVDFLYLGDETTNGSAQLYTGMSWDMAVSFEGAKASDPIPVQRPREPGVTSLTEADFSENKTLPVRGRLLSFQQLDREYSHRATVNHSDEPA